MPRRQRMLCDGGLYHIINRGHNKQKLYRQPADFIIFKKIIASYLARYKVNIFHYCLMSNHFHLLLKVCCGNDLPRFMKSISQAFAHHLRRTYRTVGYVFQARYKSPLIQKEQYLFECGRYIERNPLRAGIVTDLADYPWSSYHYYARGLKDDIITTNPFYNSFGEDAAQKMKNYALYSVQEKPYEFILDKAIEEMM